MSIYETPDVLRYLFGDKQPEPAEQMVSQPNAEIALKSLMDAELALTKARDLLRRSWRVIEDNVPALNNEAGLLLSDINDLLGG